MRLRLMSLFGLPGTVHSTMKTLYAIFLLLFGVSVVVADTEAKADLRFAGVWFYRTLNADAVAKQFPVGQFYGGKRISTDDSVAVQESHSDIAKVIYAKMQEGKKAGGDRLMDRLGDGDETMISSRADALVMACALNYEHVEVQRLPLGKKTISKVLVEIGFDLVLCNFRDRRIVAIIPLRAQIVDAMDEMPTEAHKQQLLKKLYETQVVAQFIKAAQSTYNPDMAPKTIGIGEITLHDKALSKVPESLKDSIKTYYSSYICSALYEEIGVPVLPYSGGNELLYYTMREQVDDAAQLDVQTALDDASAPAASDGTKSFILKKPDYTVDVVIPDYQTQVLAKKKYQRHLAFVAACRLTLKQGEKSLFSSKFIDSVQAMYTHDADLGLPWIYYQAATYKMFKAAAQKLRVAKETKSIIYSCSNQ